MLFPLHVCPASDPSAVPHHVTLQDVARTAGVHRSTASLSLRNHPRIPEATRQRVKAAALQLGYQTDPLISALMQSRRSSGAARRLTLAFLQYRPPDQPAADLGPDYFPGAAQRARDFGFQLERFVWSESDRNPRRFSDRLSVRFIAGVIIDRTPPGVSPLGLEWDRFSCVSFGMPAQPPALHHLTENHFDAVCQAMDQCRARGYRRIGFVLASPADRVALTDRALGAYTVQQLRAVAEARLPVCPGQPATAATFARWFDREQPDALLVDDPAPVHAWLRQLGRSVPQDVGLVSVQPYHSAKCSGYHCDPAMTGALAVEMVLGMTHRKETGIPLVAHEILVTGEWRDHGTLPTRPAPSAPPGSEPAPLRTR